MGNVHDLICGGMYLSLIVLTGYVTLCLTLKPTARPAIELVGFSFAAGSGVLPLLLFMIAIAGFIPSRIVLIAIALLAISAVLALYQQKRLLRATMMRPTGRVDPLAILSLLGGLLITLAILNVATRASWPVLDDVDSFAIWMFKAKWVAVQPLRPIPTVFRDPILSYSHQDYPLALPFLTAGLWAAVGRIDDTLLKTLLVPTYLCLIAVIYSAARRLHRAATAIVITAIFVAAPTLSFNAGLAIAETPLLLAYAAAVALLLRWMESDEQGDLLLAALFAVFAALAKNEGLALLPILGVTSLLWVLTHRSPTKLREWAIAAVISAATVTPWLIYRSFLPRTHEDYGTKLTQTAVILKNLSRAGYAVPTYLSAFFDGSQVGVIWYVLLIAALLGWRGFRRGSIRLLWTLLFTQLGLYLLTFIVTPWDVEKLLPMIAPKLLTQASPVAALLIALHLQSLGWPGSLPVVIGRLSPQSRPAD